MDDINWFSKAETKTFEVYNIIGGKKLACDTSETVQKHAARDGSLIAEFGAGKAGDVDAAVASAKKAFDSGVWHKQSVYGRAAVLKKLADLLEEHAEEFALYESMDVGKPIVNAQGDVATAAASLRDAADGACRLGSLSALDGGCFSYQLRRPLGVVAGIVGWNYPLVLACQKVGPALIMGNSLVLKPSEFTSLSAWRLAELALEAGLPDGVFNVVNGLGRTVGDALARHNHVRLLSFTGSSATGKLLMVSAGQSNMKRLILECGGKSPFLVFDDYEGDLDALAKDIVIDTAFRNQGALCVSSTRVLLQAGIREKLLPKILDATQAITPADPLLKETTFGAIMNKPHMEKVLGYVQSGLDEGAELLCGGRQVNTETGGYYLSPAIFDKVNPAQRIAKEETFGPLVSLFTFETEEEAVALANDTEYGLAAYAATSNANRLQRLARDLEAGIVSLVADLDAVPGGFFFGVEPQKQSGLSAEGGSAGLLAYTATSHIMTYFKG